MSVAVGSECLPCKTKHEKITLGYYQDCHVFICLYVSIKST